MVDQRSGIAFQKAEKNRSDLIKNLLEKLYLELGEEREYIAFLSIELIHKILDSGRTEIYLAIEKENVLGILTLSESQAIHAGGNYGIIDEIYILPEHRNRKIGQSFIEFVAMLARERNWRRVDVTAPTDLKWQKTIDFYENNGFEFTGPKLKRRFN